MKTEQIRTCSNCHYWRNTFRGEHGVCSAPLPLSFVGVHIRRKVKAAAGSNCYAHRMRAVRKVSHQTGVV